MCTHEKTNHPAKIMNVGLLLITFSWVIYGIIFITPFFCLTLKLKALICTVSYCSSHVIFWLGVLILGKEAVNKYKSFNLFNLLRRLKRM